MTYEEKAAIIISQLREDRDRLLKAIEDIKAEIEESYRSAITENISYAEGLERAWVIIDKHIEGADR